MYFTAVPSLYFHISLIDHYVRLRIAAFISHFSQATNYARLLSCPMFLSFKAVFMSSHRCHHPSIKLQANYD